MIRREATFGSRSVWWEVSDVAAPELVRHDMAATAFIHRAMHHRQNLHIDGPVSASLLEALEDYTALWPIWRPGYYHRVSVTAAEELPDEAPATRKAVAAFSGGVDASFTLWRHVSKSAGRRTREIAMAALIHGFDIPLEGGAIENAERTARAMLDSVGVPLAIVRTNWQTDVCLDWEMEFGAGLSSALRIWQGEVSSALLGSDEDYGHLVAPWGSHPISNPMLSSSDFRVVYDAGEFTRSEKVAGMRDWPAGLQNLRVCWQGPRTGKNCGVCEKCIRTKLNFLAVGIPLPDSLPGTPTAEQIRGLRLDKAIQVQYLLEILEMAKARGLSDPWMNSVQDLIRRTRVRHQLREVPFLKAAKQRLVGPKRAAAV